MLSKLAMFLLLSAHVAVSQVYFQRIVGHTPYYESIFLPKDPTVASPSAVLELGEASHSGTDKIDRIFADPFTERTNNMFVSCLPEVPINEATMHCQGALLDPQQCREFLRDTVAIPRRIWTKEVAHVFDGRYVCLQIEPNASAYVIDMRAERFGIVFFPDGTYRCVVDPAFSFVTEAKASLAGGSETNGVPPTSSKP